jgi:branched-subunit amino acid aminotransferase/4-amino-4-deoxychorismate lyase
MTATTTVRERRAEIDAAIWPDGAAFIDGDYVPIAEAKIPILDWGFLSSDCTYDVVHVWGGRFFRLDHHLDRFTKNVEALRLRLPLGRDEITAVLMRLMRLTGLRDAYVELICTRGVPPKGSRDPRRCQNRFYAFVIPFLWIATEEQRARGLHVHVSVIPRIPPQSVNPRVKNFHWGDMNRALFEAFEAGCELPVLVDYDGNVSEGPGFNLFMVRDGLVTTPEGTCLDGITRQTALDLLAEQNVKLVIGAFSPDQLRAADEAFITSTAGGIVPVTRIDHRPVGDGEPGPVTTRLKNLYWQRHDQGWDGTPIDYNAA